jgi:hypothetical protein
MAPDDLTAADCPLLARQGADGARLLDEYNAAAAQLRALRTDPEAGGLVESAEFQRATADLLAKVRRAIKRPRYSVGFIGLSQAGKSTTVNNLLGDADVCKSGAGVATSSQPARLTRAPARSLDVAYLTTAEYEARRLELCKQIDLPSPGTDDDLAKQLADDAVFAHVTDRPRLKKDREYLQKLLRAARRHGPNYLTPEGRVDAGLPFDDRLKYTTHAPGGDDDPTLLIREARFHLDLAGLPDDLELCDLPGLGSERSVDDVVTFDYLPHLSGALLFINAAMNMTDVSLTGAIDRFRRIFEGDIAGRAWLVFTRVDGLTDAHFRPGGENFFTVVKQLLTDNQVPLTQVCFVSNELYKKLLRRPAGERLAFAAEEMKQTAERPVPDLCPPELRPAWEALLLDGGIGRLRALVTDDVARSLSGEIRRAAAADLERFRREFDKRVAAEKVRLAGGAQLYEKVGTCRAAVMSLEQTLADDPGGFGMLQAAEQFRARLGQLLESEDTRRVLESLPASRLPNEFRTHTRYLQQAFRGEVIAKLIDPAYEQVGQRLDGLPRVPLSAAPTCRDAWLRLRDEDGTADAWAGRLPDFASDEVAQWLEQSAANDGSVTGAVFLELMREKIHSSVYATMHAVRGRLRSRLGEIAAELEQLTAER